MPRKQPKVTRVPKVTVKPNPENIVNPQILDLLNNNNIAQLLIALQQNGGLSVVVSTITKDFHDGLFSGDITLNPLTNGKRGFDFSINFHEGHFETTKIINFNFPNFNGFDLVITLTYSVEEIQENNSNESNSRPGSNEDVAASRSGLGKDSIKKPKQVRVIATLR